MMTTFHVVIYVSAMILALDNLDIKTEFSSAYNGHGAIHARL
jgi:hypothetical protein